MRAARFLLILPLLSAFSLHAPSRADDAPATGPAVPKGKLAHIAVDVPNKRVTVECQALNAGMPLEFFCVLAGTNEHESVLRTSAKPSEIHLALLMLGLQPGEPARYSPSANKWFPPHGPPLHITCEFDDARGMHRVIPVYRMMRSVKSKEPMKSFTWVFDGSRVMPDGVYAADVTGYVVSIVNFDLTMIDVPALVSNSNDTLEWEFNPDVVPKTGTPVLMTIEPAGPDEAAEAQKEEQQTKGADFNPGPGLSGKSDAGPAGPGGGGGGVPAPPAAPATQPSGDAGPFNAAPAAADAPISTVHVDQEKMNALEDRWKREVAPHARALREAAQAHYEVINSMRREQQRLIDEADRIQRAIDDLEKQYSDMTTPRAESTTQP